MPDIKRDVFMPGIKRGVFMPGIKNAELRWNNAR
jgi:hypothetical protein